MRKIAVAIQNKYLLLCLLGCMAAGMVCGQPPVVNCEQMLKDAEAAAKNEQYDLALGKLRAAKTCDKNLERYADSAIARIFKAIKAQRDEAVVARKEAQAQSFRAQVAALVNKAESLKDRAPYTGAGLAKTAFGLQPQSKDAARVLHDYLSDSTLIFFDRWSDNYSKPVAVNDEAGAFITAGPYNVKLHPFSGDTPRYMYPFSKPMLPNLKNYDLTADGATIIGYTDKARDSSYHLFMLHPFLETIKYLGASKKEIKDIVLSEDQNHFALVYTDDSSVVYDSLVRVILTTRSLDRNATVRISRDSRYLACFSFSFPQIMITDLFTKQPVYISLNHGTANDLAFSNVNTEKVVVATRNGLTMVQCKTGAILKNWLIPGGVESCKFFNRSDHLLYYANGSMLVMDSIGFRRKELRFGQENKVSYISLSPNDRIVYLERDLGEYVLWDLARGAEDSTRLISPDPVHVTIHGIVDTNAILISKRQYGAGSSKYVIAVADRAFHVTQVLDSLELSAGNLQQCNHSKDADRLVVSLPGAIRVVQVKEKKSFDYLLSEIDSTAPPDTKIAIAPRYDKAALILGGQLYILSLLKKEIKHIGYAGPSLSLAFLHGQLLTAGGQIVRWGSGNVFADRKIIETDRHGIMAVFVSASEEYIGLLQSGDGDLYYVSVYTSDGMLLKTYSIGELLNPYAGFSPDEKTVYVIDFDRLLEMPMPLQIMKKIPAVSVGRSLEYGVPLVLEDLQARQDLAGWLQAFSFYLNRYFSDRDAADKGALNNMLKKMKDAFGSWKYELSAIQHDCKEIIELFGSYGQKDVKEIIDRFAELYRRYAK